MPQPFEFELFVILQAHIHLTGALLDHSQPEAASLTGLTSDLALMLILALFDVQPSAKSLTFSLTGRHNDVVSCVYHDLSCVASLLYTWHTRPFRFGMDVHYVDQ